MDDMTPNDGSYFHVTEPADQVTARTVSANKSQAAKPVIEEIILKIDEDIALMSSVDAIHLNPEAEPEAFMRAYYGVQERIGYARQMKDYMEALLTVTR